MTDVLLDSDDEEKERSMEAIPKGVLGKVAKQRFEIMLRQVTFQRGTIARAMAFAIDHADAADEVYFHCRVYMLSQLIYYHLAGYRHYYQIPVNSGNAITYEISSIIPGIGYTAQ